MADEPVRTDGASGLLARFDAAVDSAVLRLPRALRPVMWVATAIGYPAVQAIPLVLLAIVSSGPWRVAFALTAASLVLPRLIKRVVGRRRPTSAYVEAMRLSDASFPSGHAYASVAATGLYAWLAVSELDPAWAVLAVVGAVVWVAWVGLSRLFFRAHFASDVVGGWLLGGLVVGIVLATVQP